MRSWLRWCLAGSVVLSAAALLWPQSAPITQAVDTAPVSVSPAAPGMFNAASEPAITLPDKLSKEVISAATFDPFVGVVPPAPAVVVQPPPVQVVQEPPAPVAPPLNYRYLGKMTDPSGRKWVYLATPDKELAVSLGTRLDEGYVVEAIRPDGVHLAYPPLGIKALIPVPERVAP